MIDNRPKKRRARKPPVVEAPAPEPVQPAEVHKSASTEAAAPAASPAVQAKPVPSGLLSGIGAGIGSLGVLPLVLAVTALQKGRAPQSKPVGPAALPALPAAIAEAGPKPPGGRNTTTQARNSPGTVTAAAVAADAPQTGRKPRSLRSYRKPADPAPEPETIESEPVQAAAPRPPRPIRTGPKPQEIRNLLNDLSGYLPGTGGPSVARISKIMGIADELRNIDSGSVFAASAPANPMDRSIGLLNTLSRNMPNAGASNLGRASQVLSLVNTLKGTGGGGMGGMGGIGNIGNMAGMLSGMMNQNPSPAQEIKNVTPAQADGLKDTVNKLLSGMDDKKKSELLDRAKDLLGKSKN